MSDFVIATCWVLMLMLLAPVSSSAEDEPLVSNRPGFSNTWEVVQPGRVELDAGFEWARVGEDEIRSIGQVLVRAGLSERFEIRAALNSYVDLDSPQGDVSGFSDPVIGVKMKLLEGAGEIGWTRPEVALIAQSSVPVGARELSSDSQPAVLAVVAWDPWKRVHLDTNHGLTYVDGGRDRYAELFASYGFAVSLVGNWGGYFEYAGFFPLESGRSDSNFLFTALTYLSSPRMQFDFGVGKGLDGEDPDHFVSAGVAYRW